MDKSKKSGEDRTRTTVRLGAALMLLLPLMFLLPSASATEMELWDSGELAQNGSWSHTFTMASNDMYSCTPHPPHEGFPDFTGWVNVSDDSDAGADDVTIYIDGFSYQPSTVKIQPGVTVTWVNNDSAVHTATQMDMSGDMHDEEEEDGIPGFASWLAVAAITAASIVATRKER